MKDTILLKDTIHVTIGDDHSFECSTVTIGRSGENNVTQLEIIIPEELNKFWAYLDFKKPNGDKYKTSRLDIKNNVIEYDVPLELLNENGNLEVQLVLQNADGLIWKSATKKFVVLGSVDAVNEIINQEDFITKAQNLLDDIKQYNSTAILSTVTLYVDQWEGEESPYTQVVNISGTTKNSKIDLNPSVEQLNIFHNKDISFVAGNNNGTITVYCIGQKPTQDYTMQTTITEVVVNG